MIPLRTPAPLKVFPTGLLALLGLSFLFSVLFGRYVSSSDDRLVRILLSLVVCPSIPLAIIGAWYGWIFIPSFWTRSPKRSGTFVSGLTVALLLETVFLQFHVEAPLGFLLLVLVIGAVLRDQIWETVDTLVLGPKLLSVFAVPCYVHVFFFLLYIFLGQLIHPAYGLPGSSVYLMTLVGMIAGFLGRSVELKGLKDQDGSL